MVAGIVLLDGNELLFSKQKATPLADCHGSGHGPAVPTCSLVSLVEGYAGVRLVGEVDRKCRRRGIYGPLAVHVLLEVSIWLVVQVLVK